MMRQICLNVERPRQWAGKMAQWFKTLAAKPNHLSFISGTHMMEKEPISIEKGKKSSRQTHANRSLGQRAEPNRVKGQGWDHLGRKQYLKPLMYLSAWHTKRSVHPSHKAQGGIQNRSRGQQDFGQVEKTGQETGRQTRLQDCQSYILIVF